MAIIMPIKGLRYSCAASCNFNDLIAPPYDVISPELQETLYNKSPYNIIRLEFGESLPGDNDLHNRYIRAAETFREWLSNNILIEDSEESIYLYEQNFLYKNQHYIRQAIFCGVKLTPFGAGNVIPHEATLDKPKEDRSKLLHHCETNFSPIFGLFMDQDRVLESRCIYYKENTKPLLAFSDAEGQQHKLWSVSEQNFVNQIQEFFKQKNIYIADGHHRYETNLQFYEEKRAALGQAEGYAYTLMALVNVYDDGLLTLPTHRLITSCKISVEDLLQDLSKAFIVNEIPRPQSREELVNLLEQFPACAQDHNLFSLGFYAGDERFFTLVAKDHPSPWLDTVVLQDTVFKGILGMDSTTIRNGSGLRYTRDEWEAKEAVDKGEALYAFYMNKPSLEDIISYSEKGFRLPQKSTYFYPKFYSGIVMHKLT